MITLLQIDTDTVINIDKIVKITIVNLQNLRQERRQHYQIPEQRERMDGKYWEVSVYLRSDDGDNAQRVTKRFETKDRATQWVQDKFGAVIVAHLCLHVEST